MIAWLEGEVKHIEGDKVVILAQGVGYEVFVGPLRAASEFTLGDRVEMTIRTLVKEDAIRLFGFKNFKVRELFDLLLGVNGVGPKVAIRIVDTMGLSEILATIANQDHKPLQKVPGIGKKSAERILVELKDKLAAFGATAQSAGQPLEGEDGAQVDGVFEEALSALVNLGFAAKEAQEVISRRYKPAMPLGRLIRDCLGELNLFR